MYSISALQKIVEDRINTKILNTVFYPGELFDPIKYVLSIGGKRLRPVLTMMACNLFSDNIENSIDPAIGIEIFHNFTLLHDDILDNALIRRNHPTVHKKWDVNTAILSGDAMMIKAYEFISECNETILRDVLNVFTTTALEVCQGQQYDMNFENRADVTVDEYLEMIRLKTSVLIAACFKLGAIVGNAPKSEQEKLYQFGQNIGLAFQLQDDYLDVYGNVDTFGKEIGGDIISNKKTFLLIQALQNAKGNLHKELLYWLNLKQFDRQQKILSVRQIYDELNLKDLSYSKMEEYHQLALWFLNQVQVNDTRKSELKNFADKLLLRTN
jgi:geranylgeranyl diphosphate synthase type II